MKKILILLLIFASFQTITAQKVAYGVKGGANYSSYIANYGPIDYNYKLGFQLGGFAKIGLVERLYLQPELLYSLQGTRYDIGLISLNLPQTVPGTDPPFKGNLENITVNESTIVLPVMLKYYFTSVFNIEIGPQLDYVFYFDENHIEYDEGGISSLEKKGSSSEFNFGANLGVGYEFNKNLGLGLRYNYGFNHIHSGITKRTGDKRSNSVFSLSLAYSFN